MNRLRNLFLILYACVILPSCTPVRAPESFSNVSSENTSGSSFYISPLESQKGRAAFQQSADSLTRRLIARGLRKTNELSDADFVVVLTQDVGDSRNIASSLPVFSPAGGGPTYQPSVLLIGCLVSTGCGPQPHGKVGGLIVARMQADAPRPAPAEAPRPAPAETREYHVGPGDRLKVTVFGQDDISGEYAISTAGTLAMRLSGEVRAEGLTITELQETITRELAEIYFVDPQVTVEVLNYRPFFILGEVNRPGSYPYISGIVARQAVALAGGFTRRGRESSATLIRKDSTGQEVHFSVGLDEPVMPGDTLMVERRLF